MTFLSVLIALFREVMPFIKEALLEGQTFGAWLRNNWMTFTALVVVTVLTFNTAYLVDSFHRERKERQATETVVRELKAPLSFVQVRLQRLMDQNAYLRGENKRLSEQIVTLTANSSEQATKLQQYEKWMKACGVDPNRGGQCRAQVSATPKRRAPTPKPKPDLNVIPPPDPPPKEEKRGFWKSLRDALSGKKNDE